MFLIRRVIIAEKAIAGRRIADILSDNKSVEHDEKGVPVFEFDWNGRETVIIPLRGHIINVDYPEGMNNWEKTPLEALVISSFVYKPTVESVVQVLEKYAKDADRITIATDYDTEGESIGREAVQAVKLRDGAKVDRARFSAIIEEEIKDAFQDKSIVDVDNNLADSADTRRETDLMWGSVLTRYISQASGRLGKSFLSVGRVQSPTLALIVDKEKERLKFTPMPFWLVTANLDSGGRPFEALYAEEKIWDKKVVERVMGKKYTGGTVLEVTIKTRVLDPPTPFNTTEYLRAASNLGVAPGQAMAIAESLYMNGFTSYPRTDNTVYPPHLDIRALLEKFAKSKDFGDMAQELLKKPKLEPTQGKKRSTDHPPIHPVEVATRAKLSGSDWKIYEMIVRRFFATLAEKSEMELLRVDLDLNGEKFFARGKRVLKPGWKRYYHYSSSEDVILPELRKGDKVTVNKVKDEQKETQPPARYSGAALIKTMEDLGLGTKSTRHEIISKLSLRGYIHGRSSYEPSDIGFAVTSVLEEYVPDITKPDMTAKLEKDMGKIEEGKLRREAVIDESRKLLKVVLKELTDRREKVSEKLREALREQKLLGACTNETLKKPKAILLVELSRLHEEKKLKPKALELLKLEACEIEADKERFMNLLGKAEGITKGDVEAIRKAVENVLNAHKMRVDALESVKTLVGEEYSRLKKRIDELKEKPKELNAVIEDMVKKGKIKTGIEKLKEPMFELDETPKKMSLKLGLFKKKWEIPDQDMEKIKEGLKEIEDKTIELMKVVESLPKEASDKLRGAIFQKCGGNMKVIRSRRTGKRFAGCSNFPKCFKSYPLPQRGRIRALGEVCPSCGEAMIEVSFEKGRPFKTCINHRCETKKEILEKLKARKEKKEFSLLSKAEGIDERKQAKEEEEKAEVEAEEDTSP